MSLASGTRVVRPDGDHRWPGITQGEPYDHQGQPWVRVLFDQGSAGGVPVASLEQPHPDTMTDPPF